MEKNLHVVVSASVERFRQQMEAAGKSTGGFRNKIVEASAVISEQKQILIEFETELVKLQDKLKSTSSSNIAGQKALKSEIQRLTTAIKEQKLAVRELSTEKANMSTSLQEVRGRAEANTQAMEAMTRAVNAASMAVLLLGDENGELQPLVKAAQVTMAVFGATVAVVNLFIRENNVLLTVQNGLQKAFATVVGTSTGMLKGFRIALASTGVLLAVVAIGYLIEKLVTMGDSLKNLEKDLESLTKAYEKFAAENERLTNIAQRETSVAVARAKLAKKSEKEILEIMQKGEKDKLILVNSSLSKLRETYNKSRIQATKEIKDKEDLKKKLDEIDEKYYKESQQLQEQNLNIQQQIVLNDVNFQQEMNDKAEKAAKQKLEEQKKAKELEIKTNEERLQSQLRNQISELELNKQTALGLAKTAEEKAQIELDFTNQSIQAQETYNALSEMNKDEAEKNELDFATKMNQLNTQSLEATQKYNDAMSEAEKKRLEDSQRIQKEALSFKEESFKNEIKFIEDKYAQEEALAYNAFKMNKDKAALETQLNSIAIRKLENIRQAYLDAGLAVGELDKAIAKMKAGLGETATKTEDIANKMAQAIGAAFSRLASDIVNSLGEGISRYFEGTSEEAKIGIELLKIRQKELQKTMKDMEATDEERLRARLEYLKGEEELLNMQQSNLQQTFNSILSVVADFMDSLGKALIATAIASETFRDAIATNPPLAIAAGAALIGLAAITKSQLEKGPKFAKGGIAYGEVNNATFGEYPGARNNPEVVAPLDKLKSILGIDKKGGMNGRTEFVYGETYIKGSDLAIVMKRANRDLSRG